MFESTVLQKGYAEDNALAAAVDIGDVKVQRLLVVLRLARPCEVSGRREVVVTVDVARPGKGMDHRSGVIDDDHRPAAASEVAVDPDHILVADITHIVPVGLAICR